MTKRQVVLTVGSLSSAVLLVTALVLVLTREDTGASVETTGTTSTTIEPSTTSTTLPDVLAPLTGLPVSGAAVVTRPALVVKIDNADTNARPQQGINEADIVYEEKVEGGVTRFAAVFHSRGSDPVGPIRSARSTDIALVGPLQRPLFAFSGANAVFIREVRAAPLIDVGADVAPDAYTRRKDRRAPDNLYSTTDALWGLAPADATAPQPVFTFRSEGAGAPSGTAISRVNYQFGGGRAAAVDWVWDPAAGRWLRWQARTPHVDETGEQVAVANVVVMFVRYADTGLVDVAGTPVPEAELVGEGEAWVFNEGRQTVGIWRKDAIEAPVVHTDPAGQPIALSPGRTWVALVPIGGATVETCEQDPASPACGGPTGSTTSTTG